MAGRLRLNPRVARALRQTASAIATGLGTLLLVADSTDDCDVYKSFRDEFDFVSTCTPSGASGSSSAAGTSGFGASAAVAGTSGTGGAAGSAGTAGAAGSSGVISGHVSLSIPKFDSVDDSENDASKYATEAFQKAGLAFYAGVRYRGDCSGGEGTGTVDSVVLTSGSDQYLLTCDRLKLPVHSERTVTCTQQADASVSPTTCTITFTP